eukprot:Hpha_TRINITY_DN11065_c0_g1::TRINITY_DN11065_c0_g1_i1::g.92710::m.92710
MSNQVTEKPVEVPHKVGDDVGPTCLADIMKGQTHDGDCGTDPHTPPAWLDLDRYNAGRAVFEKHVFNFGLTWHFSLVMGFSVKPLLEALVFTGQSSTPGDAIKRYINTYKFLATWHLGDIFDDTGSDEVQAFSAIQSVRTFHATVRTKMQASLPDTEKYMNQYDMCLVQTGFMGVLVIAPQAFGLKLTQQQTDDYVYFWRCVAHQLGVSDTFNLCGQGNPSSTNITWEVVNQVLLPSEGDAPEPDYDTIVNAYLDGVNGSGIPIFSLRAMQAYTYRTLKKPFPFKLTCADRVRVLLYDFLVLLLAYAPGFAYLANAVALCATRLMLKQSGPCTRGGQGICPVVGAMKSPEEMQALKGKCPGSSAVQKEPFMQRFTRNAFILAATSAVLGMALFWFMVIVGGIAYAAYFVLQHAY